VFEDPQKKVPYDIILGQNFLKGVGIQLDFVSLSSTWLELTVPMRPHGYWNNTQRLRDALSLDPTTIKVSDSYTAHPHHAIADAKYEKAEISEVMADITYLTVPERSDLYRTLLANEDLFSGKLGCYPNKVFSLKLKPDAKPFHSKPYAVPHIHLSTFKKASSRRNLIALLRLVFLFQLVHPYGQLGILSSQRKMVQPASSVIFAN
jgi:hypothetical protein